MTLPGDTSADLQMLAAFREHGAGLTTTRAREWSARREAGGLYLYVNAPSGSRIMYQYVWGYTADDDPTTGVGAVNPNDLQWLIDYARAKAKYTLARVIGKYGGINMPDGSVEQLDGDALRQEGREEEQQLIEAIKRRRVLLLPEIG